MQINRLLVLSVIPLVAAAAPATKGGLVRPTTQVTVIRPTTSTTAVHPATKVVLSRPQSEGVVVSHPSTAVSEAAATGANTAAKGSNSSGKSSAVNGIPSGSSKTSMSGFQGKQATDFKAAQTGTTSANLGGGGQNNAAKDSLAKSSDAFKGLGGNLDAAMKKGGPAVSQSKIAGKVKGAGK